MGKVDDGNMKKLRNQKFGGVDEKNPREKRGGSLSYCTFVWNEGLVVILPCASSFAAI